MVVYTGFDPRFRNALDALRAKAGFDILPSNTWTSGTRRAYDYAPLPGFGPPQGASQAYLYAHRGEPGISPMAAPPGSSMHNYGIALDSSLAETNPTQWNRIAQLAPSVGLRTIPGDPGHIELAAGPDTTPGMSWQQAMAQRANMPSQSAQNMAASTPNQGGGFAVPGSQGMSLNTTAPLGMLMGNIRQFESGGNYNAVGPTTRGDRPYGAYQVMGNNVGPWTEEILGQRMTPQQFLASPAAQDAVAQGKLGGYMNQFGPAGAARAWFTGSPTGTGTDVNNTTADRYVQIATRGMGDVASNQYYGGANTSLGANVSSYAPIASPVGAPSIASSLVGMVNPAAGQRMAASGGGIIPSLAAAFNQNAPTAPAVGPGPGNVGPVTGFLQGAPTNPAIGADVNAVAPTPATTPTAPTTPAGGLGGLAAGAKGLADALSPQQQSGQQSNPAADAMNATAQQAATLSAAQGQRMAQAAQMYAQMAKGPTPLKWGKAPPGSGMGMIGAPGMGTPTPGGGMVGQGDMGMALNSVNDLYGYG